MSELPDFSNFFSSLDTELTPAQVADLYGAIGWRVGKRSWEDYEVTSDWGELVIEDTSPILMHGPVADLPGRVEELVAPLRKAGITFSAECYGPWPEQELLLEIHSWLVS